MTDDELSLDVSLTFSTSPGNGPRGLAPTSSYPVGFDPFEVFRSLAERVLGHLGDDIELPRES